VRPRSSWALIGAPSASRRWIAAVSPCSAARKRAWCMSAVSWGRTHPISSAMSTT